MTKVKLTKISHYTTDRNGGALITKDGKPYERCIITDEDGNNASGFGSKTTHSWKEGDTVEIDIVQKGQYLNFYIPKTNPSDIIKRIEALEEAVEILNQLNGLNK